MKRWLVSLCLFAGFACAPARPQGYDLRTDREPIVSLESSKWRFHPGDDPSWASPSFDDSTWVLLKADTPWTAQGYKDLTGFAWYRFKVDSSGGVGPLALRVPVIHTNYDLFADGKRIGGCGQMLAKPVPARCFPLVFQLPAARDGQPIVVAIRVWHWAGWAGFVGGGPARAGLVGASALILKEHAAADKVHLAYYVPYWVLSMLYLIGAVAAFCLYLWRQSEKEYLWFAIMVFFEALQFGWSFFYYSNSLPVHSADLLRDVFNVGGWFAGVVFFGELLHAKRGLYFKLTMAALVCLALLAVADIALETLQLHVVATSIAESVLTLFPSTWIVALLFVRARRKLLDAVLLMIPVTILYGSGVISNVFSIGREFGLKIPTFEEFHLVENPFPIDLGELASFLFLIGMLAILINRFTRTRRVEERYAAEFESARHIQEVLVPVPLENIPGFTVEAEYRPARVVGGDFYQVLPDGNDGLLIVVGDVAGKGMPAAMLVAMIIGVVRTQAAYSADPATMLMALNDRLCGYSSGGFSTCLVAHISKKGALTLSNAGHLSPYLNGRELPVAAALPLGIETGIEYVSEKFTLASGDRLTFISDGIVEATNAKRELFGFERTEAISTQRATEIIATAQAFGQNDDLTVVIAAFGM